MRSSPSNAGLLFEELSKSGIALVRSMIDDGPTFETDWLEFKSGRDHDGKPLGKPIIKQVWSEALSGFANSGGGLLIWGVKAEKREFTSSRGERQMIDCAVELSPVDQPEAFESRLRELQRSATDPPLRGVEYLTIKAADSPDEGCIACLIPDGNHRPYRADQKDSNYYIRAGDSFSKPSVTLLRQLFYPQFTQDLRISTIVKTFNSSDGAGLRYNRLMTVFIHNMGVLSARDTQVHFEARGIMNVRVNKISGWDRMGLFGNMSGHVFKHNSVLHPKNGSVVFTIELNTDSMSRIERDALELAFDIFVNDSMPQSYLITYSINQLEDRIPQVGTHVEYVPGAESLMNPEGLAKFVDDLMDNKTNGD